MHSIESLNWINLFGRKFKSLPFLEEFALVLPKPAMFPAFPEFSVLELAVTVIPVAIAVTVMVTIVSVVRHVSTSCRSQPTRYHPPYTSVVMPCNIYFIFLIKIKCKGHDCVQTPVYKGILFQDAKRLWDPMARTE